MRVRCLAGLTLALVAAWSCNAETPVSPRVEVADAPTTQALLRGPRVELDDGVVQGEIRDGSRVFIGIPYAAPPLGERRWQPPMPAEPWDDVLDATGPGRTCLQFLTAEEAKEPAAPSGAPIASEDCLQLNVFAPQHTPDAAVPVMVWLHGGSNATGSANDLFAPGLPTYDGVRLRNAAPREVIVVSVNYRLGPLGFLAHPALSKESSKHVSGNYGLLDQQAALRWVKKNIAAFGGDPKNVTLFGESAGSFDTCYQSVLSGGASLFQRMIMESGSCTMKVDTLDEGQAKGAAFAEHLGCDGDDECALACLRAKPAAELQATRPAREYPGSPFFANPDPNYEISWGEKNPGLTVVVDGVHLKEQPIAAFAAGRYAHVPAIIGTNARETADTYTEGTSLFESEAQLHRAIEATFDAAHAVERHYAVADYPSLNEATIALTTDYYFACPAWQLARRLSRHSDVYLYNWTRGVNTPDYEKYGAAHSVELVWVWNLWVALGAPEVEASLVAQTADYWTALAENGDPNREGSPSWPKYVAGEDQELDIDVEPSVKTGRRDARCQLWSKAFAKQWGDDWQER